MLPLLRLGRNLLRIYTRFLSTSVLYRARVMAAPRYIPSRLEGIENIEDYHPGGYHPMSIDDVFDQGRFRILHKLGFGGSSTVWMARDQREGEDRGRIVTLKAMRADVSSSQFPSGIPELAIPQKLRASLPPSESVNFQTIYHHFFVQGPNGSHLFLISPLAGPSILAMSDSPGRVAGSRRLRADLARKVAKQTATTLHHMHNMGIVHGDLTTSNILFRLSPHVLKWSDGEVYCNLGHPETENVRTRDGQPLGPHAPAILVAPIENSKMTDPSLLQESTIISDFGQSYVAASPPSSYEPGTVLNYQSPEARFEGRAGFEADIWSLGCAIFEIRAGYPLFDSFLGSDVDILKQTIELLGRLPDPWWGVIKERLLWFEEDGQAKSEHDQDHAGVLLKAYGTSIREKLSEIGEQYDLPPEGGNEGPMMEKHGVRVPEEEIKQLADLLENMLRYRPEERIRIQDVIRHLWFTL